MEFELNLYTLLLVYLLEHSGFAKWDSDYVNSFLIFGKIAFWGKMVFIVKIHEIFHNLHDTVRVSAGRVFPVHPDFHFYWLISMFSWTCKYTFEVGRVLMTGWTSWMTDGQNFCRQVPADKNIFDSEHVFDHHQSDVESKSVRFQKWDPHEIQKRLKRFKLINKL